MNDLPSALPACLTRRDFLSTSAKLGAVIVAAPHVSRAQSLGATADTINVAVIGWGQQGNVLANAALKIPGIRFKAVCDISSFNRRRGTMLLSKYKHDALPFEDYREMLATVNDLDAVIVATPDFKHAEHTNAALRAGRHVYCEKLMSNTVEGARSMVLTARETKKLLQIGHQRRSNPCYLHAREKIVREARLLGRITNVAGEWHRSVSDDLAVAPSAAIPPGILAQYGFANMHECLNWRWFRRFAGGPISDLGAHQIDVFNWMLEANPRTVLAGGGIDYYPGHEWYDNAVAVYEYPTRDGIVRATYDVLTTTCAGGGYHEYFMGDEGSLKISENPRHTKVYREDRAPSWEDHVGRNLICLPESGEGAIAGLRPWEKPRKSMLPRSKPAATVEGAASLVDVRESAPLSAWDLPVSTSAIHQPHLENFFDAMRKGTPLNCPAESAFASAVTVLSVNQAIAAERKLTFSPDDFVA
jgi:predicted dehydrogenase